MAPWVASEFSILPALQLKGVGREWLMVMLAGLSRTGYLETPLLVLVNFGTELYSGTPPSIVQGSRSVTYCIFWRSRHPLASLHA